MLSAKCCPFCLGLSVLKHSVYYDTIFMVIDIDMGVIIVGYKSDFEPIKDTHTLPSWESYGPGFLL